MDILIIHTDLAPQMGARQYLTQKPINTIDIEYNKSLDRRRPCLEDELNGGSNKIVQSNKSV